MAAYKDAHHRSILKAMSWRVLATITTIIIFFALTGKFALAMGAGAIEVVVKLILYYFHERIWGLLGIGRKEHPLSSLRIRKALDEEDLEIIRNKLKELGYIGDE